VGLNETRVQIAVFHGFTNNCWKMHSVHGWVALTPNGVTMVSTASLAIVGVSTPLTPKNAIWIPEKR